MEDLRKPFAVGAGATTSNPDERRLFASIEEARAEYDRLHSIWWAAHGDRTPGRSEEAVTEALGDLRDLEQRMLWQFGKKNPKYPDCESCLRASVFGGPGHEPSRMCRSGKRPHCTCDACF